jgi:hypothetical protein
MRNCRFALFYSKGFAVCGPSLRGCCACCARYQSLVFCLAGSLWLRGVEEADMGCVLHSDGRWKDVRSVLLFQRIMWRVSLFCA